MGAIERVATRLGLVTRAEGGDVVAPTPEAPEGFAPQVMPPSRSAGPASLDQLLTLDAVYRAFQLYETGVLQLSLDVWRTMNGRTERIDAPPVVAAPSAGEPGAAFYANTTLSLAARGNAYWRKHRDAAGTVQDVELLDPLTVTIERDRKRRVKLFHTAESPYFGRTKADVWFRTPADAENAGFAAWNHKKKAAAK